MARSDAAPIVVDEESAARIRDVPHFRSSPYRDLDIQATLRFFAGRYLEPLRSRFDLAGRTALDCASGYGWLSLAYVLSGGGRAIALDLDLPRLRAGERIASILGVADRVGFAHGTLDRLPLADDAVDFAFSIETLEHLGSRLAVRAAVAELGRVGSRAVLLSTPNKLFPAVAHDTRLPLLHWLPPKHRRPIARLMGRERADEGNEFLTPMDLGALTRDFRRVSRCLAFAGFREYRQHYPFYLPYLGTENWRMRPPTLQALYYAGISTLFGTHSHWLMPNLAGLYVRRDAHQSG